MLEKITNDGKGKWQSFEAKIQNYESGSGGSYYSTEMVGYGATEKEARENLTKIANKLIKDLQKYISGE